MCTISDSVKPPMLLLPHNKTSSFDAWHESYESPAVERQQRTDQTFTKRSDKTRAEGHENWLVEIGVDELRSSIANRHRHLRFGCVRSDPNLVLGESDSSCATAKCDGKLRLPG